MKIEGNVVQGGIYKVYTEEGIKRLADALARRIRKYAPKSPEEYERLIWSFVEREYQRLTKDAYDGVLVILEGSNRVVMIDDPVQLMDALEEVEFYDMI